MAQCSSSVQIALHTDQCLLAQRGGGLVLALERRSIYRGVFTSVKELRDEIHWFIKVHNAESAKPFKWTKSAAVIINSVERAKKQINEQN